MTKIIYSYYAAKVNNRKKLSTVEQLENKSTETLNKIECKNFRLYTESAVDNF